MAGSKNTSVKPDDWLRRDMAGVKKAVDDGPAWMRQAAARYASGRNTKSPNNTAKGGAA